MNHQEQNHQPVRRRRIQASMSVDDIASLSRSSKKNADSKYRRFIKYFRRFWRRIPALLRVILAGLLAILFLTATVAVTRSYLIK